MSKLITNTIRHTGGSADNITLDNSQNVTVEGNATVDGTSTLTGNVTASGQATVAGLVGVGATSPNSKIHTLGSDATNTRINVQSTSATVDPALQVTNSGNTGAFNDVAHITTDIVNGNAQGCLIFKTRSADGAGNDAAERVRIQSGGGISFNGDTAAANALDDYEEGIYTVTPTCGSGSVTFATNRNECAYTKVGRICNVTGRLDVSAISSPSGDIKISLPFTAANLADLSCSSATAIFTWNASGDGKPWVGWVDNNEAVLYLREGHGDQPPNSADRVQVGTEFRINLTYVAA